MFAFPKSLIKFAIPDMVLTLAFVNVKSRKYLLSRKIFCVVAQHHLQSKLMLITCCKICYNVQTLENYIILFIVIARKRVG